MKRYLFLLMMPKIYPIISFIFKIIFPFLVAFIISFLLNPIVIILEKQVKKRWLAVLIVLLVSIIIIFLFTNYILNILINEVEELNNKLPSIIFFKFMVLFYTSVKKFEKFGIRRKNK